MTIKKLMFLTLCLASALTLVTAQDEPKLPEGNAPAGQVAPAGNNPPAQPVPTQPAGDFEKFPECRLYATGIGKPFNMKYKPELFKELIEQIGSMTSVAAFYDKNASKFDTKHNQNVNYDLIVWNGYIPIKKAGTYTFLVTLSGIDRGGAAGGFACTVNGKSINVVGAQEKRGVILQGTVDADLKVGMNKLSFCVYANKADGSIKPAIRYKLQNAIGDFREFTPANLSHKVEAEDW